MKKKLIKFNINFIQLAVPLKIYADSESILKGVQSVIEDSNTSRSLPYKAVCIDEIFAKPAFLYIEKKGNQ